MKLVTIVLLFALSSNLFTTADTSAAQDAESACFEELAKAAKTNSAFNHLDLSKVTKISGKTGQQESSPFSVETYNDFSDILTKEIPFQAEDLKHFPSEMSKVASAAKFLPKVYKSNRNNSAFVLYESGVKTKIEHWVNTEGSSIQKHLQDYFAGKKTASFMDDRYTRQKIDGYYVDSRYITFGRESDLAFSFPTDVANPESDSFFPIGRLIMDMREYMIYTHHLKPSLGGDLLSCELIRVAPKSGYKLKDYEGKNRGINWENYGQVDIAATNMTVQPVGDEDEFRKAEIDFSVTTRQDINKRLLRFHVLSINYDNKNSFMNTYRTVQWFNEAMLDAKKIAEEGFDMRRAFYQSIIDSDLEIGN